MIFQIYASNKAQNCISFAKLIKNREISKRSELATVRRIKILIQNSMFHGLRSKAHSSKKKLFIIAVISFTW